MDTPSTPQDRRHSSQIGERIDRPIVLVGLMGVGKSTVGKTLAGLLGTSFADADAEIEKAARQSITEIFEYHGEAAFRDGERRVIARLVKERHGVIATGGGAFVDPQTRALVLSSAIAVWIDCDVETLVERTGRRRNRPLLNRGDPQEILARLHAERSPIYAEAHVRVSGGDGSHFATANRILENIDAWL